MNGFEELEQAVRSEFPSAEIRVDGTVEGPKTAWLDILYGESWIVVEWRKSHGIGVSFLPVQPADPSEGLFSGPDELFMDWAAAQRHVLSLLAEVASEHQPKKVALG
jgi:hypothetical protein